jgi:pimeloyl-ACP methyl ester carboxylesterase
MKKHTFQHLMSVIILALLVTACSSQAPASQRPTATPIPSGMVDVGGYALYYECSGQGSPTVILEAGSGTDSSTWSGVIVGVEGTTHICAYDRAGLGRSNRAPAPRTYADMTGDLDILLERAQIEGPYVLVGWSMGGDLVRLFTSQHPEDVVGMVLVDSAHPGMAGRLLASLPPETANETEAIAFLRDWFTCMADSSGCLVEGADELDSRTSREQMQAVGPLGDLPLVVITQNPDARGLGYRDYAAMEPFPEDTDARIRRIWQDLQSELVGLSSNSTQVFAQGGHGIPIEEPQLVVDAILELVNEIRSR